MDPGGFNDFPGSCQNFAVCGELSGEMAGPDRAQVPLEGSTLVVDHHDLPVRKLQHKVDGSVPVTTGLTWSAGRSFDVPAGLRIAGLDPPKKTFTGCGQNRSRERTGDRKSGKTACSDPLFLVVID